MKTRDLGVKYVCFKCESKFYDLHKPVPVCPKCGADQREARAQQAPTRRHRSKPPPEEAVAALAGDDGPEANDPLDDKDDDDEDEAEDEGDELEAGDAEA